VPCRSATWGSSSRIHILPAQSDAPILPSCRQSNRYSWVQTRSSQGIPIQTLGSDDGRFWHLKRLTVPQTLNSDSRISSMSSSFRVRISAVLMLFRSFSTVELFLLNSTLDFRYGAIQPIFGEARLGRPRCQDFSGSPSTISRRIFGSTLSQTAGILPSFVPLFLSFCSSSSSSILASRDSVSGQDRDTHTKIPRLERHNILVLYCFCLV